MDYLKRAFNVAQKEKLNIDGIIEMFGDRADVEHITKALLNLYFDYTRTVFLLEDRDSLPSPKEIENEIYWLRNVIEVFQKMREPNGRVQMDM